VFLGRTAKEKDVVYVCKTEIQAFEDLMHETLEILGGVTKGNAHEAKLKKAESGGDCCLLVVFRVERDLMISTYQVNLRKGGAAGKTMGEVLYVWDWIPVRDGLNVKGSVVSTWASNRCPSARDGGRTRRALGVSGSAVPQHGVELWLSDGQVVWCQAAWSAGYR